MHTNGNLISSPAAAGTPNAFCKSSVVFSTSPVRCFREKSFKLCSNLMMTDIESLRQRDKEFNIEEKLVCCVWVHDRLLHGKTFDDIQRDFEIRFQKKAPKHDLLIMWERNIFNSGSVNFDDNTHMFTNGQRSESPSLSKTEAKCHFIEPRNGVKTSTSLNSNHRSPQQNGHLSSKSAISSQPLAKRLQPATHSTLYAKNLNALYKTELCRQFIVTGHCDYAEKCLYAHGELDLKHTQNYRTKMCLNWASGHCHYGANCRFLHPNDQRYSRKGSPSLHDSKTGYYQRAPKMARTGQY